MAWLNDLVKKASTTAGNFIQSLPSNSMPGSGTTYGVDVGKILQNWGATKVKASDGGDVLGQSSSSSGTNAVQISSPDANGMAKFSDGTTRFVGTTTQPKTQNDTTGGGAGSGDGSPNGGSPSAPSGFDALIKQAQDMYNTGKSQYYDPMMEMLKGKRNQFQDLFRQGEGSIAEGYSKNAGEAGATGEAQRTTAANSARALGTGGSFVQGTMNRINDALARTLASVGQARTQNEQANREQLGTRNDWATQQELGLNNYLGGLQSNVDNARSGVIQAIANLNAPTIDSSYGTTVNPSTFDGITNYLNGLNTGVSGNTNTNANADMGVNLDPNSPYYQFLKKQGIIG